MKKTFAIFGLLCGMASLSHASSFSTATNLGSASANGGTYCGGIFRLSSSFMTTSGGLLPSQVNLKSMEIQVRGGGNYNFAAGTCLQIVKMDGTASKDDFNAAWAPASGNTIFTSAALGSTVGAGGYAQFDFGPGLTLASTQNYAFRFVTASGTGNNVTYTQVSRSIAAYLAGSTSGNGTSFTKDPGSPNMGGPTIFAGQGSGVTGEVQGGGYLGNVRVNTSTVPEPATATLGLLGLASLMLRRRRAA